MSISFSKRLGFFAMLFTFLGMFAHTQLQAQTTLSGKTAVGRWKTIDDETGDAKSVVEIYEQGGKYFGKIVELYRKPNEDQNPKCTACQSSDARYNQTIKGMVIIRNMKNNGSKYADGDILDPKKGSVYSCTMWLEKADVLKVRGWWGFVYRTQTWHRVN